MDTDTNLVYGLMRHLCPDFSFNHFTVYRLLWRIEPRGAEEIIGESGFARATVYKILRELLLEGLVEKTISAPIQYYAVDPLKAYGVKSSKLIARLERGRERLKELIENSSGLGGEVYFIKRDGGQTKLINPVTRETIHGASELTEIRRAVDEQLLQLAEARNPRHFAMYKR